MQTGTVMIDYAFPHPRTAGVALLRDVLIIGAAAAFVALAAQIRIPLPFTPVPLTAQTFAVLLAGAALGARRASAAMFLYLLAGGVGLPVFTGFGYGAAHLSGPTGGYLWGFVPAAWLCGFLARRGWDRGLFTNLAAMALGSMVIYLAGVIWLGRFVGYERVFSLGILPFLPGDLLKILVAGVLLPGLWRVVGSRE